MNKVLEALYGIGEIEFENIKSFYEDSGDIEQVKFTKQYKILEQAITPPTEEEVCKALSEYYGDEWKTLYDLVCDVNKDMAQEHQKYKFKSVKSFNASAGELSNLPNTIMLENNKIQGVDGLPKNIAKMVIHFYEGLDNER